MGFFDTQFALETSDVVAFSVGQRTAVEMQVCVSIAFESTWLYKNLKHPRFKNFYGYAQVMSGAFVVQDIPLSFLNQEIIHWRDESFGINETIGCYAKALAAAMDPSRTLVPNTVKTRQRYTSIRFRLLPGIIANISYVWESAQAKCEGNILEPADEQGQPPTPNNSGASDNPRPGNQGGDALDPSDNDGNYNPSDGLPPPPSAGGGSATGEWKVPISGYSYQDEFFTSVVATGITDATASVSATTEPTNLQPNVAGKADYRLKVTSNGADVPVASTGFALQAYVPYYY